MTDIRARLAQEFMDGVGTDERDAYQAVDALLSLPGAREFAAAVLAAADMVEREAK